MIPETDETPEFSRKVDLRQITVAPLALAATAEECRALAARFDLVSLDRLEATVALEAEGGVVTATGRFAANWVQSCAVSGEDLPVSVDQPLAFRFVPASDAHVPDEEIELTDEDCDEIAYTGTSFDVGEAVAQSVALAIDPFAAGPNADTTRKQAGLLGEAASGPFAALAGLNVRKN